MSVHLLNCSVVVMKYGRALSWKGKYQTITHTAETDSSELCYTGSDFYKACDIWVKFWDNINELYRARSLQNTIALLKEVD